MRFSLIKCEKKIQSLAAEAASRRFSTAQEQRLEVCSNRSDVCPDGYTDYTCENIHLPLLVLHDGSVRSLYVLFGRCFRVSVSIMNCSSL